MYWWPEGVGAGVASLAFLVGVWRAIKRRWGGNETYIAKHAYPRGRGAGLPILTQFVFWLIRSGKDGERRLRREAPYHLAPLVPRDQMGQTIRDLLEHERATETAIDTAIYRGTIRVEATIDKTQELPAVGGKLTSEDRPTEDRPNVIHLSVDHLGRRRQGRGSRRSKLDLPNPDQPQLFDHGEP